MAVCIKCAGCYEAIGVLAGYAIEKPLMLHAVSAVADIFSYFVAVKSYFLYGGQHFVYRVVKLL